MGITKNDVEVLFFTKSTLGVSFTRTLTLGRLQLFITKENIEKLAAIYAPSDQGHFSKVMNMVLLPLGTKVPKFGLFRLRRSYGHS